MQKLGYQKPCWDQAILSSLVNKQVDTDSGHSVNQFQEDGARGKQTLHVLTQLYWKTHTFVSPSLYIAKTFDPSMQLYNCIWFRMCTWWNIISKFQLPSSKGIGIVAFKKY